MEFIGIKKMKRYNVEIMLNKMKELKMNKVQFANYCDVTVYNINQVIYQKNMDCYRCALIVEKLGCSFETFITEEFKSHIRKSIKRSRTN